MKYTPSAFNALFAEVERQGGGQLPDACAPQDITYTSPPYNKAKIEPRVTCGCGRPSRFVSVYFKQDDETGFITACADCDSMGVWPRFAKRLRGVDGVIGDDPDDELLV